MALVDYVAEYAESKADAKRMIDAVVAGIRDAVYNEESVRVRGLGTVYLRLVAEKSGVSKLQGKETEWNTPEHLTASFTPDNTFMSYLNTGDYPDFLNKKEIPLWEDDAEVEDDESTEDSDEEVEGEEE